MHHCNKCQNYFLFQEPFLLVELLKVPEECAKPLTLSISKCLPGSWAKLHLPIDTLALLHLDLSLEEVGVALWTAVQEQLKVVVSAMLWKVRLILLECL